MTKASTQVVKKASIPADGASTGAVAMWHYQDPANGSRLGPLAVNAIRDLIAKKSIQRSTLVWRDGWKDWQPASSTELASEFTGPPPLPIGNGWAWALATAPLWGSIIALPFPGWWSIILLVVINVATSYLDEQQIKRGGLNPPSFLITLLLVPVYLYMRGRVVSKQISGAPSELVLVGTWIGSLVAWVVIANL